MSAHTPIEPRLQQVVDQLCNDGCRAVSQYIVEIELHQFPASMQSLSDEDVRIVLQELKDIMAVYDRCGVQD